MLVDRQIAHNFTRVAASIASVALSISVAVLIAWLAGADEVPRLLSGDASMKFNAALAASLIGTSTMLFLRGWVVAARFMGLLAALIAGITLAEHIFDLGGGFDEFLVTDGTQAAGQDPGRMAPNSAAGLLLLGLASSTWKLGASHHDISKPLAASGGIIGLLGLTGYATGTTDLFGVGELARMAVPTALVVTGLGVAHILALPDRGLTGVLAADGTGGELARRLLPIFAGAPLLLGWIIFEGSDAGLYDVRAAAWILLISVIVALTVTTLVMARSVEGLDAVRKASERRGLEFFRLSQDMLATIDRDGHIADLNEAWTDSLGYSEADLKAKPFIEFVHRDDRVRAAEGLDQLWTGSESMNFEHRWRTKDGGWRRLYWSAVVSPASDLIVARATDVTDLKRQETELLRTVEELGRSNEDLEQFASVASHDLSEPLRTIKGFGQLLERRYENELDERGRHYLEMIVQGTTRLQDLINDLLVFSRAGQRAVEISRFDLTELIDEVLSGLGQRVEETQASISIGPMPEIAADRSKVSQLFQNLISNALTFTQSRPQVRIRSERLGGHLAISVEDNGIGIPEHQRDRVFEPFRRLHTRSEYDGSGIGLAVCQRIVERHGGEIRAEETPGGGTTITFTLPTSLAVGSTFAGSYQPPD